METRKQREMRTDFCQIRPVLIVTIRGKYCSGCSYNSYGFCQLFTRKLSAGDFGLKRCKECIKAEKKC